MVNARYMVIVSNGHVAEKPQLSTPMENFENHCSSALKFVCNWPGAATGHWGSWPLLHFWSYLQPLFTSITLPQQHRPPCPLNRSSTLLTQPITPSFSLQYGLASAFLFPQLGTLIPSGCPIPIHELWLFSCEHRQEILRKNINFQGVSIRCLFMWIIDIFLIMYNPIEDTSY